METENLTEEQIIRGCMENNRKFQEILYRIHAKKFYAICKEYTYDSSVAQEILQDGFVKVFNKIKEYTFTGSFEGWLRKIFTNTAIDYYRKSDKMVIHNIEIEKIKNSIPEESESSIYAVNDILNKIKNLPKGAQNIFNLFAINGYSHEEIATKLNITVGTSKSQLSRARSLLKTILSL